jgi:hypothetical protein
MSDTDLFQDAPERPRPLAPVLDWEVDEIEPEEFFEDVRVEAD